MFTVVDETDVPIPPIITTGGRAPKYPFREMEVGDIKRFIADLTECKRIQRAAAAYSRRNEVKLLTRKLPDGLRVWRTE
jgi:hypothetical protein